MNPIVLENQRTGDHAWEPGIYGAHVADDVAQQIKGYASAVSVGIGESIDFHVTVAAEESFTIWVYRLGWYGGRGARLVASSPSLPGVRQPTQTIAPATGTVSCSWAPSMRLPIGPEWTSGLHVAVFATDSGWRNVTPFVVRDSRRADLCVLLPFATYQAYNVWPMDERLGRSLHYGYGPDGAREPGRRASVVSFDRPFAGNGLPLHFADDRRFITWAERQGYDLTYASSTDLASGVVDPGRYAGLVFSGHDSYWSAAMRDAAEAARSARTSLVFLSAGSAYWHARLEPSGDGRPGRTLVCYKDGADPAAGPAGATGKWRARSPGPGRPERELLGVQLRGTAAEPSALVVRESGHWFWRDCDVRDGDELPDLTRGIVDALSPATSARARQVLLAASPTATAAGEQFHAHTSLWERRRAGLVFVAGTMGWNQALGDDGDDRIQQATANLLTHIIQRGPGRTRRRLRAWRDRRPQVSVMDGADGAQTPPTAVDPINFSIVARLGRSGRRVLLEHTASGLSLPAHEYTEAAEINDFLGARLGLVVTTLECLREDMRPGGRTSRVYLHEEHGPVPGSSVAGGAVWLSAEELEGATLAMPEHGPLLREVLTGAIPDPARSVEWPWTGAGWFAEASAWTADQLRRAGREPLGPMRQLRVREWSAVCTVQTSAGTVYFKALPIYENCEPAVTAALSRWLPGWVPTVLAVDPDRGWMLTDDFGPVPVQRRRAEMLAAYLLAVAQMAKLQLAVLPRLDELTAVGCPARPTATLPQWYEDLLLRKPWRIRVGEADGLTEDEHKKLLARVPDVEQACEQLTAMGVPDSLLHGDFWRGNVAVYPDAPPLIFDWAAASTGHPFFALKLVHKDLFDWNRAWGQSVVDQVDEAYLGQWAEYGDPAHLRETLARSRVPALVHDSYRSGIASLRALLKHWGE